MKIIPVFAALGLAGTCLSLAAVVPSTGGPEIGKAPPEINGKAWLNTLGKIPNLANLRGQAVLIEFWATW